MGGGGFVSDNVVYQMAMYATPHSSIEECCATLTFERNDPIPWYKKPNLRGLYLLLFPCVIGIEMTSGFDSQIINSAQLLPTWKECEILFPSHVIHLSGVHC